MAFNPLVVIVGVAVAAVGTVAALTYDRWAATPTPAEVAAAPPAPAPAAPPAGQQTAAVEPKAAEPAPQPAAPAPETPAAAAPAPKTPAAAAPAPEPAPATPPAAAAPAAPEPPTFDIIRVEPDGSALVAGRATPGAEVSIKADGKTIGQATASARGEWVWTSPKPLDPGSYAVTLEAAPGDGGKAVASEQAVAVVVPDRPDTPLVVLTTPQQPSQVIQKPGSTEVAAATPPAQATAPATPSPAPGAAVSLDSVDYNDQGDIVFSGRGTPGSTVRLYVDNDFTGDAVVSPDGAWSWSGKGSIVPGQHTLRADQLGADAKVSSRVELPFVRAEPKQVVAAKAEEPSTPAAETAPSATPSTAAAQPQPAAEPAAQQPGRIVIQPGNNLWNISRVLYGKGTQYSVIYEANKDLIRDPSLIYPGQIFTTPGTTAPSVIDPKWRKPLSEVTGSQGAGQSQN